MSFDSASAKTLRDLLKAVAVYAAGGRKALSHYAERAGGEIPLLTRQLP
jgi:ABC-type sulfate transport system substrate-binding protein